MQSTFSRTDSSLLGQWWWTVDRLTLLAIIVIMGIGVMLSMAASPAVATHIGLPSFYFVKRHIMVLPVALFLLLFCSFWETKTVQRAAFFLFCVSLLLMVATFFWGTDIKGARRWLNIYSFSLQPSEFMKPALAVMVAWVFTLRRDYPSFPGHWIACGLLCVTLVLLALQPDFGMIIVVSSFWLTQLFVMNVSLVIVSGVAGLAAVGGVAAYYLLPHVAERVNRFLDFGSSTASVYGEHYQISRALDAFMSGGLFGQGPGEGTIKRHIPDVHADFVLAVAGEEFGLFFCWLIVGVFVFVVARSLIRIWGQNDLFRSVAAVGLLTQFGLQALVNMASTTRLIPTKGMTLPFMSYGGSSLIASAIAMGFVLALTRRRIMSENLK